MDEKWTYFLTGIQSVKLLNLREQTHLSGNGENVTTIMHVCEKAGGVVVLCAGLSITYDSVHLVAPGSTVCASPCCYIGPPPDDQSALVAMPWIWPAGIDCKEMYWQSKCKKSRCDLKLLAATSRVYLVQKRKAYCDMVTEIGLLVSTVKRCINGANAIEMHTASTIIIDWWYFWMLVCVNGLPDDRSGPLLSCRPFKWQR